MTNEEKYINAFTECFGVDSSTLNADFVYQCVPSWDSVGHMSLIATLEDVFEITMETDDIIDFGSFTTGKETLGKYGITF